MSRTRGLVAAAILASAIATDAGAAGPVTPRPDPEKGQALAERVCVTCHIVAREATSSTDVPSFAAIANKPGQTLESVAGRIVIPHPPMPTIALSREEIANVVAYIMTLKK
jgi:cytochrome c